MFFVAHQNIYEASSTNRVDPDQTAPVGAVWSGNYDTIISDALEKQNRNGKKTEGD